MLLSQLIRKITLAHGRCFQMTWCTVVDGFLPYRKVARKQVIGLPGSLRCGWIIREGFAWEERSAIRRNWAAEGKYYNPKEG